MDYNEMSNLKRSRGDFLSKNAVKNIPMQRKIVGPISVQKLMQPLVKQSHYITKMDHLLTEHDVWRLQDLQHALASGWC